MKRIALLALVACAPLAGCSSSNKGSVTAGDTTLPSSTSAASVVETTAASSTTGAPSSGWETIDPVSIDGQVALPCCGDDFHGTPSPVLPEAGAPLPDGNYFVRMEWPTDPTQPLELQLYRYESCAILPEGSCEDPTGADNMGIDMTSYYSLTIEPTDTSIGVLMVGFRGFESTESATARGTVPDLVELVAAINSAYDEVFAARLAGGETPDAILADVSAHPVSGFGPGNDGSPYSITYTYDSAPPVLMQVVFDASVDPPLALRGSDSIGLNSVAVRDGQMTLMVYAGFYS